MRGKCGEVIIWLLMWPFGISLDAIVSTAYPSERRIERWLSISEDFQARQAQPALLGLHLLGHPVSGSIGRLRIRPIQFQLRTWWSQCRDYPLIQVKLDIGIWDSILWWRFLTNRYKESHWGPRRSMCTSSQTQVLCVRVHSWLNWPPQIKDVVCSHERSAHQCAGTACDLAWSKSQAFEDTLQDSNVAIMCSNVFAIAYLRNQGGTRSLRCATRPYLPANGLENGPWHWCPGLVLGIYMYLQSYETQISVWPATKVFGQKLLPKKVSINKIVILLY